MTPTPNRYYVAVIGALALMDTHAAPTMGEAVELAAPDPADSVRLWLVLGARDAGEARLAPCHAAAGNTLRRSLVISPVCDSITADVVRRYHGSEVAR